jgi:hypothetical protein
MTFSVNNRLILEEYIKSGLKSEVRNGIATPGQRNAVKGLKVLVDIYLSDGRKIPKGSLAYIKEEVLHNHSETIFKPLTCDTLPGKFMVVDLQYVEFFNTGDDTPKDVA